MNTTDLLAIGAVFLAVAFYYNFEFLKELLVSDDGAISAGAGGSRDIAEVVMQNDKNYLVLFGSQTGTAEDYAKKFSKELINKFGLKVICVDVENYDFDNLNQLPENVMVSVFLSTYGEGDFPDGALNFEEYLNEQDAGSLENIKYTIFGLGNTTYEFFNSAAKKAMKALDNAGARLVGPLGEGDDGKGTTDEDFLSWKETVLNELKSVLQLSESENKFKPSFKYVELEEVTEEVSLGEPTRDYMPASRNSAKNVNGPFTVSHPYIAPITESHELFRSNDRNCIHSEFDISNCKVTYKTGDHLAIWPSNANEKVEQFLSTFKLNGSETFDLQPLDSTTKQPFPCPTTIESVVRHYLEITGPLSRQSFGLLTEFAPMEIKEYVKKLSEDKDAFAEEITSKNYNLADALLHLSDNKPWANVPWGFLLETIPHLQPRYYSISSSSNMDPTSIHVTSIVENTPNSITGSPTLGVTTNLIRNISVAMNNGNDKVLPVQYDLNGPRNLFQNFKLPVYVRSSNFKLPSDPSVPIIMIGPGTGVAPFRGFVRDRVHMVQQQGKPENLGKMMLFYGCRDHNDHLYANEWPEYCSTLEDKLEVHVAYSRVDAQKVYVQDKIRECESELVSMLNAGANIYVCGDASRMAKDVQKAIATMIAKDKNISESEAGAVVKAMKVSAKYQEDVW
ncbi:NADPH--cytochrome P450 reductase KNAG_0F03340 [Huiozyma naganishii CBS 8797]|uniref:NADPH--cytochrome P450 reductase n=1 Tax=Huiozyma naganishii (strain ATCC MYA-139 / BCRC 22969 / CBS 8797 / KCTC 17520 / NBRC 10181 / NCYC 3082 / Yp74L-3) TaxID=1071383 RepID=J7S8N6_HUIN7|nr:hypothetical protein KNAG_0F03340 [Kazachstania naganishii CBS 8797]CCK70996.1 hypothetical protein KNAG_0F03340 [Kazachstania naganishii CBS 8797]